MYLQENTEAARAMRKNIARLLRSDSMANRELAFEMIRTGGMPIEVLLDVYELYYHGLNIHHHQALKNIMLAKSILQASLPPSVFETIDAYINSIDISQGPRYFIFRGFTFFELLIAEKAADIPQLVICWQDSNAYLKNTDLTWFLLEHLDAIDKNIFIDKRLGKEHLNHWKMKVLFETDDLTFDKASFLAQYLHEGYLDLSLTRISQIPDEYVAFEGITRLNLIGTQVTSIPEPMLRNIKEIKANTHATRAIKRQVTAMEDKNFYFAAAVIMTKAKQDIAGKNFMAALQKFKAISIAIVQEEFSAEEEAQFWELYFDSAFRIGDMPLAQTVLEQACKAEMKGKMRLRWKHIYEYVLQWTLNGTIAAWQALVEQFKDSNLHVYHLLSLKDQHFWVHAFRTTVSQKRFSDARTLLQLAILHAGGDFLHRFPWYLYFKHLHEAGDTEAILGALAQYPKQIWQMHRFWSSWQDRIGAINNIWITAHLQKGNLAQAEILCTSMISYFHQIPAAQRDRMSFSFYHAQKNALSAYRHLAKIYSPTHPICSTEFTRLANKYESQA